MSSLKYFTGYLTILGLKFSNKVIKFEAEIPDTFYQLGSDLVSINLLDSEGKLAKYHDASNPLEITFQLKVMVNHYIDIEFIVIKNYYVLDDMRKKMRIPSLRALLCCCT